MSGSERDIVVIRGRQQECSFRAISTLATFAYALDFSGFWRSLWLTSDDPAATTTFVACTAARNLPRWMPTS
ncbi:MAG: hypothetical protein JWP89_820 [Schlesneria sp.]|nr:hypothetical protein [Schlesneria sp.]